MAEAGEAVAGEQRLLDSLDPILPPTASLSKGQEHFDPGPVGQLCVHPLLVPRASAHGVPTRLERCILGHAYVLLSGPDAVVAVGHCPGGSATNVVPIRVVVKWTT